VARRPSFAGAFGLALVGVVVAWLIINLIKTPSDFGQNTLIGLTNGSIYALVALGYTLVYGILELINFAHGDVCMLGGMFACSVGIAVALQQGDGHI
jgi:branched-chain amino acid transport system permease protein